MNPSFTPLSILDRIPKGAVVPERFAMFLTLKTSFLHEWTSLRAYGLKRTATRDAVPFLRLPDGGVVALWYDAPEPAVVHIGAHGEWRVVAHDFDDFLRRIGARCTGTAIDDAALSVAGLGVPGLPRRDDLRTVQERFTAWVSRHTALQAPRMTSETELVRQRMYAAAEAMIRDGCSTSYRPACVGRGDWWSMIYQIDRTDAGLVLTYRDYGQWVAVPAHYALAEVCGAILALVQHPDRPQYELSVSSPGIVSVDGDRELVLVPPLPASP
jgi:hypothetical protein